MTSPHIFETFLQCSFRDDKPQIIYALSPGQQNKNETNFKQAIEPFLYPDADYLLELSQRVSQVQESGISSLDETSGKEVEEIDLEAESKKYKAVMAEFESVKGSQFYQFALTDSDGSQKFGFCKRFYKILSVGSPTPDVICFLSEYSWPRFFGVLLDMMEKSFRELGFNAEAENLDKVTSSVISFIDNIWSSPVPEPDSKLTIPFPEGMGSLGSFEFRRPSREEELHSAVDFTHLATSLSYAKIISLFAGLLAERRIIVSSSSLERLSGSVHALMSILRPFEWPFVFIPILPNSLLSFTCAPTPFIIGVHSSSVEELDTLPIGEVLFVDLDAGVLLFSVGDVALLPIPHSTRLTKTIKTLAKVTKKGGELDNAAFSSAFAQFFAGIFRLYRIYVVRPSSASTFDETGISEDSRRVGFKSQPFMDQLGASEVNFFRKFSESTMWDRFIQEYGISHPTDDWFDGEIRKYEIAEEERRNQPGFFAKIKAKLQQVPPAEKNNSSASTSKRMSHGKPPKPIRKPNNGSSSQRGGGGSKRKAHPTLKKQLSTTPSTRVMPGVFRAPSSSSLRLGDKASDFLTQLSKVPETSSAPTTKAKSPISSRNKGKYTENPMDSLPSSVGMSGSSTKKKDRINNTLKQRLKHQRKDSLTIDKKLAEILESESGDNQI